MPIELPDPDKAPSGQRRVACLLGAMMLDLGVTAAACWQRGDLDELTGDEFIFGDGAPLLAL
jgi:hypothetical protein